MGCIRIRWVVASRCRAETKRKQPPQTKNSSTLDYFQKATSSSIVLMFMGCIRAQWAGSSGCQAAAALCWFSKLRPRTNQPLRKQPLIPLREIKRGGAGKTTKSDVFLLCCPCTAQTVCQSVWQTKQKLTLSKTNTKYVGAISWVTQGMFLRNGWLWCLAVQSADKEATPKELQKSTSQKNGMICVVRLDWEEQKEKCSSSIFPSQ